MGSSPVAVTSCCNLKIRGLGAELCVAFNFERNYNVLKSNSPCILLNKNINFAKNEKESKIENFTHSFIEMNLVLQIIWESQIKSKTVMSWSSRKKKRTFFVPFILSEENFFNICVLFQCIVYWIHSKNTHTFTYRKTLLHKLLMLAMYIRNNFARHITSRA